MSPAPLQRSVPSLLLPYPRESEHLSTDSVVSLYTGTVVLKFEQGMRVEPSFKHL